MNNSEIRNKVIRSAFTLARSLKRTPHHAAHRFSPSVERSLLTIYEADGLSARDLGEALDIRPSSVSELISRLVDAGLVNRAEDEQDKRMTRISLTEKGKAEVELLKMDHEQNIEAFSSCFTDEEAEQFCALVDKLSAHLQEKGEKEAHACRIKGGPRRNPGVHGHRGGFMPGHGPMERRMHHFHQTAR